MLNSRPIRQALERDENSASFVLTRAAGEIGFRRRIAVIPPEKATGIVYRYREYPNAAICCAMCW